MHTGYAELPLFETDDTVFHYTRTETALNHILWEKKLLLGTRKSANDPVEHVSPILTRTIHDVDDQQIREEGNQLSAELIRMVSCARQLSFCKNDILKDCGMPWKRLEYYGCFKPRMWDQYADRYKGVCIAFSKDRLVKKANIQGFDVGDVDYVDYSTLSQRILNVDLTEIRSIGIEKYRPKWRERVLNIFMTKHNDYSSEHEFRIMNFSDTDRYIDVSDCLKGIVVSSKTPTYLKQCLREYALVMKIKLYELNWQATNISVSPLI